MSAMMNGDEKEIAQALTSWLVGGDDPETDRGVLKLHPSTPLNQGENVLVARDAAGDEYEVTITARRKRG